MNKDKEQNRRALTQALYDATRPEITRTWCWDMMVWEDVLPILHLYGDHGTPDFTLTFYKDDDLDIVLISPDSNPSWAKKLITSFSDAKKCANDIVATTMVINLTGSI